MDKNLTTKRLTVRVRGKLKEVVSVHDKEGNLLHRFLSPLMVEFYPRDVVQVIVGSALLAVPVGFTEETWKLGETLPLWNVFVLFLLSLLFISVFSHYNYYRGHKGKHKKEFLKRIITTYLVSFIIVGLLLTIIQRAPWSIDWLLALKRTIIVSFPASMSAAVADVLK